MLVFEWDDEKAKANLRVHGVPFEEAIEVFDDDFALEEYDVAHSKDEPRFNIIGLSSRRLYVCRLFGTREGCNSHRLCMESKQEIPRSL